MGQEQIVFHAVAVVVGDVLAEVAVGVPDLGQPVANGVESDDVGSKDIGAAAQLSPRLLVPDFAVAPLALQVASRAGQQPGQAAPVACLRRNERHFIPETIRILKVVNAGQLVDHSGESRMQGDIRHLLPVQPYLAAILQAFDVAGAGHGAKGGLDFEDHASLQDCRAAIRSGCCRSSGERRRGAFRWLDTGPGRTPRRRARVGGPSAGWRRFPAPGDGTTGGAARS